MASLPATAGRAVTREHAAGAPDWTGSTLVLMTIGLIAGFAVLLLLVPIGSGDYGQWLMVSRHYAGLPEPAYRSIGEVPPLVPWLLAGVHTLVTDPVISLHVLSVGLMALMVGGFAVTAGLLFRSRSAGFVAAALALCGTDQFLGLFSFGGLLQVAAIGLMTLSVAAFSRASLPQKGGHAWAWCLAGSVLLVLAALSHLATGAIALVAGPAIAVLGVGRLPAPWRERLRALLPLAVSLAVIGIWWIIVLLPSSAAYVSNPASLNYRGPDRLWDALAGYWPTLGLMAVGTVGLVAGSALELRRRAVGPFTLVAAWAAIVGASLAWSMVTGAATDYPRFTTPILAPLVVGAAGVIVAAARWVGHRHAARWPLRPGVLGVGLAAMLVIAGGPMAMGAYADASRGYAIADPEGLQAASAWLQANLPANASVLASTREGKWIEGLTGHAALFDNPIRYSFRPGEWSRSIAARTLLQGTGSITNEFFLLRTLGGDPCGNNLAADSFAIAANHGGEYVDLLTLPADGSTILAGDAVLATVGALSAIPGPRPEVSGGTATVTSAWSGQRQGRAVAYHRKVSLASGQSALQVVDVATSSIAISGLEAALQPAIGMAITHAEINGATADVTFTTMGLAQPQLRITVSGPSAAIRQTTSGGLVASVSGTRMELVVVDQTASAQAVTGLGLLCPADLVTQYQIGAVVLRRDAAFASRSTRMAAIGFSAEHDFGGYAVLARP